jgi:hypothetical protein
LKATEQPIDTSTAAGKCFLDMLGAFAEFETNERQLEGIAKAKAEGVYRGRKPSIDVAQVREMKAQGLARRHGHREGAWHRSGERLSGKEIRFEVAFGGGPNQSGPRKSLGKGRRLGGRKINIQAGRCNMQHETKIYC